LRRLGSAPREARVWARTGRACESPDVPQLRQDGHRRQGLDAPEAAQGFHLAAERVPPGVTIDLSSEGVLLAFELLQMIEVVRLDRPQRVGQLAAKLPQPSAVLLRPVALASVNRWPAAAMTRTTRCFGRTT